MFKTNSRAKKPLTLLSARSKTAKKVVLSLCICTGLSISHSVNADTIKKYNRVQDEPRIGAGQDRPGSTICSVTTILNTAVANNTTTIEYTAWSTASGSSLYDYKIDHTGTRSSYLFGGASATETQYTRSFGETPQGSTNLGFATNTNPFSATNNPYINKRNFRVTFSAVPPQSPTELIYSNVVDNGAYQSLPTAVDVNNNISGVGFRGFTTPYYSGIGVQQVYMSLQQPNGLYWSGTAWSHLRINHQASRRVVNGTTGRVEWSKVTGWPTATADLPEGKYTLRTMSWEGYLGNPGSGTLNTISFYVDRTSANPSPINSPANGSVLSTPPSSFSGTFSDNVGGGGVGAVTFYLTRESNPIANWDWSRRIWASPYVPINATLSGNNWSITSNIPSSSWSNGLYTMRAYTYDRAGNPSAYSVTQFTLSRPSAVQSGSVNSF